MAKTTAFDLGVQAYQRNADRKPVLDTELISHFHGVDAHKVVELTEDWLRGYDEAWIKYWKARNQVVI